MAIAALLGAFAVGGGATALALNSRQASIVMLKPGPIGSMQAWSPVAVEGVVSEVFGNKFIIQDDSGRALVDLGPSGDRKALVAKSETITVQGRFDRGFIHAQAVIHADGRSDVVGPAHPPHDGPRGPMAMRGPEGGPPMPGAR